MDITIITPAGQGSKAGNRATAERWQRLLVQAGHCVSVVTEYKGEHCDLFLALHAWRSYEAVCTFERIWPDKPLIVALTGTDIYRHQHDYPAQTLHSMQAADALIGLHAKVGDDIPERFREKLLTLYQSAEPPAGYKKPPGDAEAGNADTFEVCVIGHLRDEKDSLRAAFASRLLSPDSRIRVSCAGKPHNRNWQTLAEQEMQSNPRFRWLGELEKAEILQLMARSQVLVMSSVMEGGANVISEACRAGLPVIASDIPGNTGLLGEDYAGYYPVGDTHSLAALLARTEQDNGFLRLLRSQIDQLASLFTPENEQAALEQALSLALKRCSGKTV